MFLLDLCDLFTDIFQGYFIGTEPIAPVPGNNPGRYGYKTTNIKPSKITTNTNLCICGGINIQVSSCINYICSDNTFILWSMITLFYK